MASLREPIVIHLGVRDDGCTYALDLSSMERLRATPEARPVDRVFIAYDAKSSPRQRHDLFDWQAVQLVTGLTAEQLEQMGGIELYDPRSQTRLPLRPRQAA